MPLRRKQRHHILRRLCEPHILKLLKLNLESLLRQPRIRRYRRCTPEPTRIRSTVLTKPTSAAELTTAQELLGLTVLEPVGRLGSFGVTERRKPIGFRFLHHVYVRAHRLLQVTLSIMSCQFNARCLHLSTRQILMDIARRPHSHSRNPRRTHPAVDKWTTTCSTRLLVAKPCWAANDSHRFNWLGKDNRIFRTYSSPTTSC